MTGARGTAHNVSRAEWGTLAAILAAALLARAWSFGTTGLEHFDEGVYAISATGLPDGAAGLFRNQVVFSPPFYFGLTGALLALFGGEADRVGIVVNVVLGVFTVAAVWWVTRMWFGPRAAAIGATLMALSSFHVLMSRVMLTDVAFAFWFVLGLGLITRAVDRRDLRTAVAAGVAVGLAWNTKYHGWFALLITGVALFPDLWRGRRNREWRQYLGPWAVAALVALLVYLPWAVYMRGHDGGYGGIVSYYSSMLGLEWFANLKRQVGQQLFLETSMSRAAGLAALGAALLVDPRRMRSALALAGIGLLLGVAGLVMGLSGLAAVLGLVSVPMLLREFAAYRSRVLVCWMGLWVVAAPIYHPYARLILPFTIGTFILSAWMLDRFIGHAVAMHRRPALPALAALAAAAALVVVSPHLRAGHGDPWRPSRNMAIAAASIAARTDAVTPIYVVGEPPLGHYLRAAGRRVIVPANLGEFDTTSVRSLLVTGRYTFRAPLLRARYDSLRPRLTPIARYHVAPNDLRVLDDLQPFRARAYRAAPDSTFDLTLYEVRAVGSPAVGPNQPWRPR